MSKQDDIFSLIKSLNRNEKRFFRLQATQQGSDKTYVQVFDVLDKQKEFDAEKLKKRFSGKKINLSHEKSYLENNIMRSLRSFYSESSELVRLKNMILNIELFYQKRLNLQAEKVIDKAMALAKKYEYFNHVIELLEWQYRLYTRMGRYDKLKNYENAGMKEKENVLSFLQQQTGIENIAFKITFLIQTRGTTLNKNEKKELENYYAESLELLKKNKPFFSLTELCLICLYQSAAYLGKHEKSLEHCKQSIDLYNKYPHFIAERPLRYYSLIANTSNRLFALKKYNEAIKLTDRTESSYKQLGSLKQHEFHNEIFSFACQMRIMIYIAQKDYVKAINEGEKFENKWNYLNNKERNNLLWMIKLHIARAHFFAGNYKNSLEHIYSFINNSDFAGMKRDTLEYAYLLRLMIYYELQLFPLLENLCRTSLRFFEKQGEDEFAKKFINGIRNAANVHLDKPKLKKTVQELSKSLEKIPSRIAEKQDFVEWVSGMLK